MIVEEALRIFFQDNKIVYEAVSDEDSDSYDIRLSRVNDKVIGWLSGFDEDDKNIFLKLLSKYTYITRSRIVKEFKSIIDSIVTVLSEQNIMLEKTIFVTVESPKGIKSGGDNIRADLHERNIGRIDSKQIIASAEKIDTNLIYNSQAIIFLDDIIATGFTTSGTIKDFVHKFNLDKRDDIKLYFCALKTTKNGEKFIKRNCRKNGLLIEPIAIQHVKSAFKGDYVFSQNEVSRIEGIVKKYEDEIDSSEKEIGKSYSMGFRACKLLISFYYNTPNNTLCSFWRITEKNKPLFERESQKRPSVSDLKKTKKINTENAYYYGKLNNLGVKT